MDHSPSLDRLIAEDAVRQLRDHSGAMRVLGTDGDALLLDWVAAVPRLLAAPALLAEVEADALALAARGIRHVIWSGMGGSVLTVQVLRALGYAGGAITLHPLDSTDPAALNALLRQLAAAHGLTLDDRPPTTDTIRALLADVALVAVAMGMTSEEPIAHLAWFSGLLDRAGLPLADHALALALPGSFLDGEAQARHVTRLPLQLDGGNGTPGRMSAPATRVFLLPVALDLLARGAVLATSEMPGTLGTVLARAWREYDLDGATTHPAAHPFVRLAAALSDASVDGACALFVQTPPALEALRWWMEQLFEESLGKGGQGVIVFADQPVAPPDVGAPGSGAVRLAIAPEASLVIATSDMREPPPAPDVWQLHLPLLGDPDPDARLAGLAATMLGLQLTVALFGYLRGIRFVGQPAVEDYKARARALRLAGDPLAASLVLATSDMRELRTTAGASRLLRELLAGDGLTLFTGESGAATPAAALARALEVRPRYLDLTVNGAWSPDLLADLERALRQLGNGRLGIPVKLRQAPAAYHSTEQSEMDGPDGVLSLRLLAAQHEALLLGDFDADFLAAQAVGTWQAMLGQGRACFLAVGAGTAEALGPAVCALLADVAG